MGFRAYRDLGLSGLGFKDLGFRVLGFAVYGGSGDALMYMTWSKRGSTRLSSDHARFCSEYNASPGGPYILPLVNEVPKDHPYYGFAGLIPSYC